MATKVDREQSAFWGEVVMIYPFLEQDDRVGIDASIEVKMKEGKPVISVNSTFTKMTLNELEQLIWALDIAHFEARVMEHIAQREAKQQ